MVRRATALALLAACGSAPNTPDAPSSPWSTGPKLPVSRLEPGVTAMGQQLVVVGGFEGQATGSIIITTEVDVLDTAACAPATAASCAWNAAYATWPGGRLPDTPVPRHHVQVAALGTILYMLGGLDAADASNNYPARGDCYSLDTSDPTATWQTLDPIPAGLERGSAAVVVVPPRIYLIGGASTTAALADSIFYDTASGHWCPSATCAAPSTDLPPALPMPRSHPAAMRRVDGAFVVTGGLGGLFADSAASDTWLLPAGATAWQDRTPMPVARGGCAYGVLQGQLVCAGGEASTSALSYTQLYATIDDTGTSAMPDATAWTDGTPMPESRAGIQGAAVGQRLFVPGGSQTVPTITSGFEPTDSLFIYSPLDTAKP